MERRTLHGLPLHERLRPGRGALCQVGDFWYPARLIQQIENEDQTSDTKTETSWRVKWWRECQFATPGPTPDSITVVEEGRIVDSLWKDREEGRKIRVSFKHANWVTQLTINPAWTMDSLLGYPKCGGYPIQPFSNSLHRGYRHQTITSYENSAATA